MSILNQVVSGATGGLQLASGVGQLGNALGLGSGLSNAVSGVGSFLFGSAGSKSGVTLGTVSFQRFEVPDQVTVGKQQQLTVHRLIGGRRVINAMGTTDLDMPWGGILTGPSALTRARALIAMEESGVSVTLTFGTFSYQVYVDHVYVDVRLPNWMPYRVSCTVLYDNSSGAAAAGSPGLLQRIASSVTSALGLTPAGAAGIVSALGTVQMALGPLSALFPKTQIFGQVSGLLAGGGSLISGLSATANGSLGGFAGLVAGVGGLVTGRSGPAIVSQIVGLASVAQQAAMLPVVGGYVQTSRMALNQSETYGVGNAPTGAPVVDPTSQINQLTFLPGGVAPADLNRLASGPSAQIAAGNTANAALIAYQPSSVPTSELLPPGFTGWTDGRYGFDGVGDVKTTGVA